MPADATCLAEEGVVFKPGYLVRKGVLNWEAITATLQQGPFPTRAVQENLADLQAGLASLEAGKQGLAALAERYGTAEVKARMRMLQQDTAGLLRKKIAVEMAGKTLEASELLDDGTPLCVRVREYNGKLRIDFTGTGPVHPGNLNANPAIVQSVVLYVLRLWTGRPIPLNEGLMEPVELVLPEGTLLNPVFPDNPAACPAVVGGNTETSQRLTDTLLKAFGLAACSYGSMNNVVFGNDAFGFYETIGGGTGAIPGTPGADAVHQHMTNTRITDAEIMEFRYPVRVERFAIRHGSGGKGRWPGGCGIERKIRFLVPVSLTLLTQHRRQAPYGMEGGGEGQPGSQWLWHIDGSREQLPGSCSQAVAAGEALEIHTPGGGAWGMA
jgi:5-oxoprolinase (ATP-hydrolysing)